MSPLSQTVWSGVVQVRWMIPATILAATVWLPIDRDIFKGPPDMMSKMKRGVGTVARCPGTDQ